MLGLDLVKDFSLRSVLSQTYGNYEVIVANDGPDDSMKEYIKTLNNEKIRYYEFEKREYSDAHQSWAIGGADVRNRCMSLVRLKRILISMQYVQVEVHQLSVWRNIHDMYNYIIIIYRDLLCSTDSSTCRDDRNRWKSADMAI